MPETFFHSLHQRVLASDCELPFLSPASPVGHPDLVLQLVMPAPAPRARTPWHHAESCVIDRTGDGDLVLQFPDETELLVGGDGRTISLIASPAAYTRDDLAAYALGPALTLALHLQGAVLVHAASVVMHEKAVLFAGPSGSGKSTTAAMLHRLGYPVLSDDVTEVKDGRAFASTPTVRLWPDVLDALYGSAAAFPDRAPSWDKKLLCVGDAGIAGQPIAAILFLEPRNGPPRLEPIDARNGWRRLIAETPTARLPGAEMERKIFEVTSALADQVPLFSFVPPPLEEAATLGDLLERRLR